MSDELTPRVVNQERDERYNREGGITIIPGSDDQRRMAKFEQFPDSKWACGNPGNPYRYRPFPKMVYRAERFPGTGALSCQVAAPERWQYREERDFIMAEEGARRWNEKHYRIVQDEVEYAAAMEAGWRETPDGALRHAEERDKQVALQVAHRNHDDRNLSPAAQAEIRAAEDAAGEPLPEITEQRRVRRRKAS